MISVSIFPEALRQRERRLPPGGVLTFYVLMQGKIARLGTREDGTGTFDD